jgi:Lipid A 3-O-deacylase (PagL)
VHGRIAVVLLALAIAPPAAARAQDDSAADAAAGRWEIGPYVGVARHSPVGTHLGVTPDRDHFFIGIHAFAPIWSTRRLSLGFAPDAVPLLVVTNNPEYITVTTPSGDRRRVNSSDREPVAGFAIAPIAVEGRLAFNRVWQGFIASSVGCVWFTREVPILEARRFNCTMEIGGGVQWRYRRRTSLRLGYKFHHLSNAYTALANPGIDAAVFLAGIEQAVGRQ